ncbi:MAG: hypothetical protein CVV24_12385 [Ignavibacteriae bacterium HGW-Ignavibacteriae-3]|nr:MAG: hypothetical protein CVV24_12385 [Ignavibacteriae bacterium HGW-Ignavibacteriae-3]
MKKLIIILILLGLSFPVNGQIDLKEKLSGYTNPDELVTLSEAITFDQAVQILSKVSEKVTGKKIVSMVSIAAPIGIEIPKMIYKKALYILAQSLDLSLQETETTIFIRKKADALAKADTSMIHVDEREVKISAVMFEANVAAMQEKGVNWQFVLSKAGLSIGGKLVSFQDQAQTQTTTNTATTPENTQFSLNSSSDFMMGDFDGTATSLFRFFENENLGNIIARPVLSAINGKKGRTQVGSDFSIKEKDFSGNLVDKFFQAGTIIEATPRIFSEDGIDYVYLKVRMERSSVIIGTISTEKPKTEVETNLLLLNGEETVIGGLIVNEESSSRAGIPFLKDLPWWFFGLRYIFGYEQEKITQKEIILLIKAEILPSLKERMARPKNPALLKQVINQERNDIEKYKEQSKKKEADQK